MVVEIQILAWNSQKCVMGLRHSTHCRRYFRASQWRSEYQEKFEVIKGIIRSRKSKKDRQHNEQKKTDKQRCTKDYIEN